MQMDNIFTDSLPYALSIKGIVHKKCDLHTLKLFQTCMSFFMLGYQHSSNYLLLCTKTFFILGELSL